MSVRFPSPFSSRRLLSWAALVSLTMAIPNTASAAMFNAETFMLKNGMQVVVIPNHRLPVVHHMVWYRSVPPTTRSASRASPISSST
jgi:zinc protease